MSRSRRLTCVDMVTWLALVSALGSSLTGCEKEDDATFGTLVVPFELGNRRTCDSFGVERVRGELDDGMFVDEASCEAGEVRFSQVPAGSYRARLFALDDDDVEIMDSLRDRDVLMNVVGDGTTVVADRPVKLTATPAHLFVRWTFGFGSCKSSGIDLFTLGVWRSDGSELMLTADLDCRQDGEGSEGYREVPDPDRALAGDQVGEVAIQALDRSGLEVGEPVTFDFPAPGAGRDIKLSLECEEGACTGLGYPDPTW